MHVVNFEFLAQYRFGVHFIDFLRLRKQYFVDRLEWNIPHDDRVEFDQFDRPDAQYILVVDGSTVVGGVRLMPLDARWGDHRSMLLDAMYGRIDGIPNSGLPKEFETNSLWEGTRLVVSNQLSARKKMACLRLLIDKQLEIITRNNGNGLVTLSPPAMQRYVRILGYNAKRLSSGFTCNEDGRTYSVFVMMLKDQVIQVAA